MSTPAVGPVANDADVIRGIIARVLLVPADRVLPDADLVYDLGAESIDILDLLFNLDELVGRRVLPEQWVAWLITQAPGSKVGRGITPRLIGEFVTYYRNAASTQPATGEVQ